MFVLLDPSKSIFEFDVDVWLRDHLTYLPQLFCWLRHKIKGYAVDGSATSTLGFVLVVSLDTGVVGFFLLLFWLVVTLLFMKHWVVVFMLV
jgi:hypothetical protein